MDKDLYKILYNARYFYKIMSKRIMKEKPFKIIKKKCDFNEEYVLIEMSNIDLGFCEQELKKIKEFFKNKCFAYYVDTRFCHRGKLYSDNITLEKMYRCSNCNNHIFEHSFKDNKAICSHCKKEVIRYE